MTKKYEYDFPMAALTVDAVVIHKPSDKVLLIKRKDDPFKGRWALPGGYVEIGKDETCADAVLRELREETNFDGSMMKRLGLYDDPHRDPRGRVISQAFYLVINSGPLPEIKAGDDASEAEWTKIGPLHRDYLAFDHWHILTDALKRAKFGI